MKREYFVLAWSGDSDRIQGVVREKSRKQWFRCFISKECRAWMAAKLQSLIEESGIGRRVQRVWRSTGREGGGTTTRYCGGGIGDQCFWVVCEV